MFFIVDQGVRIQTPIDSLLGRRDVDPVSATSGVHAIHDNETPSQPRNEVTAKEEAVDSYQRQQSKESHHALMIAADIMASPVISVAGDQSINHAWQRLEAARIHHLPVVNELGKLIGILSDRDILRYFAVQRNKPRASAQPLRLVMTDSVISTVQTTSIRALAEVMSARKIGALPIIDDDEKLTGIVTRTDILRALVKDSALELWV